MYQSYNGISYSERCYTISSQANANILKKIGGIRIAKTKARKKKIELQTKFKGLNTTSSPAQDSQHKATAVATRQNGKQRHNITCDYCKKKRIAFPKNVGKPC